jgi:putative NADH-flavin reductase
MIVTIFGATGMVGKQLVTHSLAKGYHVRVFGRSVEGLIDADLRHQNFEAIKGYVFDADDVSKAIAGADAVLSALGGAFDGSDHTRSLGMKNIAAQMEKTGLKRIVALGGFGVLPNGHGGYLLDAKDYPTQYLPVGLEHKAAYELLKASALDWTFVCSPNIATADADGQFEVMEEAPAQSMTISTGNLAMFMVTELTKNEFVHRRVGIGNV